MFFRITPVIINFSNKHELIEYLKCAAPGHILCLINSTYRLKLSDNIHDKYLTLNGEQSKRYKTNLDKLIASIKRTPAKIWSATK